MNFSFQSIQRQSAWQSVLLLTLVLNAGCGSSKERPSGTVVGKVIFNGQPVTEGVVHFISKERGVGATGPLSAGGKYTLPDRIEVGDYTVLVTPPPPPPPRLEDGPPKPAKPVENIPEKYRGDKTTDLKVTVKKGSNTFDFDLKP